tara:strand:- start:71 stop:925 length:855 start_codon:yes stop_codon:yes gene_type:complete
MPPKKTQSQSQRQNVIVNIHQSKPATRKRKRKSKPKPKPTVNPFYPERIIIPQLQVKQQPTLDYNKLIDIIQSAQSTRVSSNIPARPSNPLSLPPSGYPLSLPPSSQSEALTIPQPIQRQSSSDMGVQTSPVEFLRLTLGDTVEKGSGGGGIPTNFNPLPAPEPLSTAPSSKTADESSEEEEVPLVRPQQAEEESDDDEEGSVKPTPSVYNLNDYKKHISSKYPNVADDIQIENTLDAVRKKLREKLTPTQYENDVLRVSRMARKGKPKETATDFYTAFREIGT